MFMTETQPFDPEPWTSVNLLPTHVSMFPVLHKWWFLSLGYVVTESDRS